LHYTRLMTPRDTTISIADPRELLSAFELFTRASESLEDVHGQLLQQIEVLSQELEATNAQLRQSLSETERMRLELLHIIESQPNGVWVMNPEGCTVHVNRQVLYLLNLDLDPQMLRIENLGPHNEEVQEFIECCLVQPGASGTRVLKVAPTGSHPLRHLAVSASPLRNKEGGQAGIIFVINDNTSLRQLEEENHRRERLAAMGALAGQLAHEIRNPLNSLGLFAALIEEASSEDSSQLKWCRQIQEAVGTLNTLVCNMLNLARPMDPGLVRLDMGSFLPSVLAMAPSLVQNSGIRLDIQLGSEQSRILGDPDLLRQLLINLILHTVQSMPDGGELRLRTRHVSRTNQKQMFELVVTDTGSGIEEDLIPRLFEPDFSARQGGSGLGLWIVGQIVEKHRGYIEVASSPGCGAEFRIQFPLIGEDAS
jgi:signal transduction histidine kinase